MTSMSGPGPPPARHSHISRLAWKKQLCAVRVIETFIELIWGVRPPSRYRPVRVAPGAGHIGTKGRVGRLGAASPCEATSVS